MDSFNPFDLDYAEPECADVADYTPAPTPSPTVKKGTGPKIHTNLEQGTPEWLQARCGLLTASEMKLVLTEKTLKLCANDKIKAHIYELAAQRITKFVEPMFQSFDMIRGQADEVEARALYSERFAPVREVGFITNDKWGLTLGYSPDGLVAHDGGIECKSRKQKYQVQTVVEHLLTGGIPGEFVMQHQTGMMVAELEWLDFCSYSEKLPMSVIRVHPDDKIQAAIIEAAQATEDKIAAVIKTFKEATQ